MISSEGVEVEHGVVDVHGQKVLHLETQRVAHLGRWKPGQVDLSDDDLRVGDPENDVLAGEADGLPQLLEGEGHERGVDDLPGAHGAGGKRDLAEAIERKPALAGGDLRGANAGGPDIEPDRAACRHVHSTPATSGRLVQLRPSAGDDPGEGSAELVEVVQPGLEYLDYPCVIHDGVPMNK